MTTAIAPTAIVAPSTGHPTTDQTGRGQVMLPGGFSAFLKGAGMAATATPGATPTTAPADSLTAPTVAPSAANLLAGTAAPPAAAHGASQTSAPADPVTTPAGAASRLVATLAANQTAAAGVTRATAPDHAASDHAAPNHAATAAASSSGTATAALPDQPTTVPAPAAPPNPATPALAVTQQADPAATASPVTTPATGSAHSRVQPRAAQPRTANPAQDAPATDQANQAAMPIQPPVPITPAPAGAPAVSAPLSNAAPLAVSGPAAPGPAAPDHGTAAIAAAQLAAAEPAAGPPGAPATTDANATLFAGRELPSAGSVTHGTDFAPATAASMVADFAATAGATAAHAPTAEAPASPAAPPPASPAHQVASMVAISDSAGGSAMVLRLAPVELGQVQVQITRHADAGPDVRITVERPETLALLQQDQPALQRALDHAGLPAEGRTLSFALATDVTPPKDGAALSDSANHQFHQSNTDASGFGNQASGQSGGQRESTRQARADRLATSLGPASAGAANWQWQRAGIDITA